MASRRVHSKASLLLQLLIILILPYLIESKRKFKHYINNDPYSNQRKIDIILYSVFGAIILVIICYFGKKYCGRNFCRNELAHTIESDDMRYHPISFTEEVSNFMNDSYDKIQAKIMTQVGRNNINLGRYFNHFTNDNENEQPKTKRQLAKAIIEELDEEKGLNFRGKKNQQSDEINAERSALMPRLSLGNVNSNNNSAASSPYSTARTNNNIDDIIRPTIVLKKGGSKNNIPITVEPPMEIKRKHSLKQAAEKEKSDEDVVLQSQPAPVASKQIMQPQPAVPVASKQIAQAQSTPSASTKQGWDAWNDYFKDSNESTVPGANDTIDSDTDSQSNAVKDNRFESKRTSQIKFRSADVDNDKVLQKQLNDFNKNYNLPAKENKEVPPAMNPMIPASNSSVNTVAAIMPKEISMRPGAATKLKPLENVPIAPVISPDQKHHEVEPPKKIELPQETLPVLPTIPTFTQIGQSNINKNQFISERNSPEQQAVASPPSKEPLKLAVQEDESDDDSYNIDIMAPSFEVVSASQLLHSAKSEKTMTVSPVKPQAVSPTIASPPVMAVKGISKDNFVSTRSYVSPPQNELPPTTTATSPVAKPVLTQNRIESPTKIETSPTKMVPPSGKPLPPKDLPPGVVPTGPTPFPNEFISGIKAPAGPPPKDLQAMAIDGYTPTKAVAPGYLPGKPLPPRMAPPPEVFKDPPTVTSSKVFTKPREIDRSSSPIKLAGNAAVASLLVSAPTTAPPPVTDSNRGTTTPSKPAPPPIITGRRPPAPFGPPSDAK